MNDDPLAWFITWTVYGTFLQGDQRWWRNKRKGSTPPQPLLEQWHRDRLNHDVVLLTDDLQTIVKKQVQRHCDHREWQLWACNPRINHVHVVVSTKGYTGKTVCDQLKANCTRGLRQKFPVFVDRPVWTVGGDWRNVNSEDDLQDVITYASEAQDRMNRGQ